MGFILNKTLIMLKAVIIDDESRAIESLLWELENFKDDIEVIAKFTSPEKGAEFIKKNKIDCLFLDIEMPTMDGFKFLEKFPKREFEVIITTAYNEYGIKALKENAIDYLTKPIDSDDLKKTIDKLLNIQKKKSTNIAEDVEQFEKILNEFNEKLQRKKIVFNTDGKFIFLEPEDIIYVESDGNYSSVYLTNDKKIVLTKKIKEVNLMLPDSDFFRIHNSYIINLNKVREFYKTDAYVVLSSNHKIPVSRQKRAEFLNII